MAIALGYTASDSGTGKRTPAWSNAPYVGSLLLMELTTSRTTATYFGDGTATPTATNLDPSGWVKFGDTQQSTQATRNVAQFYRVATGGALDTPSVGGYSDSARTTLAGTTYATIIELRDGVSGTTCLGSWDLTNANGIGKAVGTTAPYETYSALITTLTLTITTSSWSTPYTHAALWVIGQASTATWGTAPCLSLMDSVYAPFASGGSVNGVVGLASGTALSPVLTITAATGRGMAAYVIGFNPTTYPTTTLVAGARIQKTPAATLAAGAQIILNVSYPVVTLSATARVQAKASVPLTAGARVQVTTTSTIAAGAQIAPVFTPKILMGTGNALAEALGSQYFALSSDIDGGDSTSNQANSPTAFVYVIDGGRSSD